MRTTICLVLSAGLLLTSAARADILNWQTGEVIAGTQAITPGPGVNLSGMSLGYADLYGVNLGSANLSNSDVSNSWFMGATLTSASMLNAVVSGADFGGAVGFSASQLSSTASYQSKNLSGIGLEGNDLSGWDFSGQNLSGANLCSATLSNTVFGGAVVSGADLGYSGLTWAQLSSTASYQAKNLSGVGLEGNDLGGWDFSGQNISGANFGWSNFTTGQLCSTASYQGQNLSGVNLEGVNLAGCNFSGQKPFGANLSSAALTGASFSGATVSGADFGDTGITTSQLYSTGGYQAGSLGGIGLEQNNLSGWNFCGQNLASASFASATLTGANFAGAVVTGADFGSSNLAFSQLQSTASYQAKNLSGICLYQCDLSGWDFSGQNLTNARLASTTLTGTVFSGAVVAGADFGASNLAFWQLQSTASYQAKNLSGVYLYQCDLTGWDFSGQNLTNTDFYLATLTSANFADADLRGSTEFNPPASASTHSAILSDGTIAGLNMGASETLVVQNYPLGITVRQSMTLSATSTLKLVLSGTTWGSTISFDSGIPVNLGGTLSVTFASGVNAASQTGRTFQLFNWTGVTPSGTFSTVTLPAAAGLWWDTTALYTAGTVRSYDADVNGDGVVNAADIDAIYHHFGTVTSSNGLAQYDLNGDGAVNQADVSYLLKNVLHRSYGDANLDGYVDYGDYQVLLTHWQQPGGWTDGNFDGGSVVDYGDYQILLDYWNPTGMNMSEVPEPTTLTLLVLGGLALVRRRLN